MFSFPLHTAMAIPAFILDEDAKLLHSVLNRLGSVAMNTYIEGMETDKVFKLKDLLDLNQLLNLCHSSSSKCHGLAGAVSREAQKRHIASQKPFSKIGDDRLKILMFDYDQTLSATLSPLNMEVMELLKRLLILGKHIAIVTDQPIGERGLSEYFINPLRRFLGIENRILFKQVHLFPASGSAYYRFNDFGELEKEPVFNFSFSQEEGSQLVNEIKSLTSLYEKNKFFFRDSYVSLHFASNERRHNAIEQLQALQKNFKKPLEFRTKTSAKGVSVLHIKIRGINKSIAKYYILNHLLPLLNRSDSSPLGRGQIVCAGDKMGISKNERADSEMMIFGGKNFALGLEVHPCAYKEFSGLYQTENVYRHNKGSNFFI